MAGKISIGQYYPVDSKIHRLDPRSKLLWILIFVIILFNIKEVSSYIIAIVSLGMIVKTSKVPFLLILKSLKHILFIMIFTAGLNIFLTDGTTVLFEYKFIQITKEGLQFASLIIVRLIALVISSSLLTLTTKPMELTIAIEKLLKPLKIIGIPSHDIAMIMTIALSFIPTLIDEMEKIMKAQISRGSDFETGTLIERVKSLLPILVPLFVSSFRRADDLAMAMESRCYRGDINRSKMKDIKFKKEDYIFFGFLFLVIVIINIV